jgi:hypothetical protein
LSQIKERRGAGKAIVTGITMRRRQPPQMKARRFQPDDDGGVTMGDNGKYAGSMILDVARELAGDGDLSLSEDEIARLGGLAELYERLTNDDLWLLAGALHDRADGAYADAEQDKAEADRRFMSLRRDGLQVEAEIDRRATETYADLTDDELRSRFNDLSITRDSLSSTDGARPAIAHRWAEAARALMQRQTK